MDFGQQNYWYFEYGILFNWLRAFININIKNNLLLPMACIHRCPPLTEGLFLTLQKNVACKIL